MYKAHKRGTCYKVSVFRSRPRKYPGIAEFLLEENLQGLTKAIKTIYDSPIGFPRSGPNRAGKNEKLLVGDKK